MGAILRQFAACIITIAALSVVRDIFGAPASFLLAVGILVATLIALLAPQPPEEPRTAPSPLGTDNGRPDGDGRSTGGGEAL